MNCDFEFPVPSLAGNHQIENAATAVSVVKSIKQIVINDKIVTKGIENVFWPGRMQKINNGKLKRQCPGNFDIWLDGGHNDHDPGENKDEHKNDAVDDTDDNANGHMFCKG